MNTRLLCLLVFVTMLSGDLLSAQSTVVIGQSQSYFTDFNSSDDGWWHARPDYGTGGWNSTNGFFEMTCTSLDAYGLGNIIQRSYLYFGEEGNYNMKFRIKTDGPVKDFRVTVADYKGVNSNWIHEFPLMDAIEVWKDYSISFHTSESGTGYDEGDGSGVPDKGIWVAFRTKQAGTYYIDDIQIEKANLKLTTPPYRYLDEIILKFELEVEEPDTSLGFICKGESGTLMPISGIRRESSDHTILVLSLGQPVPPSSDTLFLSYYGSTVKSVNGELLTHFEDMRVSAASSGLSFFVATDGDDLNSGTLTHPFATLQKAASMMTGGDTCYVRSGRYHESVVLNNLSGSYGLPVIFTPYRGEHVILDGTVDIDSIRSTPWELHEGSIYKTTLTEDIWQLFADDEIMIAARWPNASVYDSSVWQQDRYWGWASTASEFGRMITRTGFDSRTGVQRPDLAATGKDYTGAMAILNLRKWETHTRIVNSHVAGSGEFTYDADHPEIMADDRMWDNGYWEQTGRFYLECHYNLIDTEKEWYYNPATKELFLWGPGGAAPENVRGRNQVYAFDVTNSEYVQIKGFDFFGATFQFRNSVHCTVEDCDLEYFDYTKRMLGEEDSGRSFDFTCNTRMQGPQYGSWNTIRNCTFAYCDGSPLTVEGNFNLLENLLFHDVDWSGVGYHGLHLQRSPNTVVRRISAYNSGASEFINGGKGSLIELCDMGPNLGALQQDGATIQLRPGGQEGSIVRFNWSHNHEKFGLRTDMNPVETWPELWGTNTLIHHNVVWGVRQRETIKPGIHIEGRSHQTYHNLSFDNETRDICLPTHIGDGPITSASYPNQYSTTRNNLAGMDGIGINRLSASQGGPGDDPPGTDDHNMEADVRNLVYDFDNQDFRPRPGPSIVDAAVKIEGVNDDFMGSAPDIGAYEAGGEYWVPGYRYTKASHPIPANHGTSHYEFVDLMWLEGYKALSHDVYFGTSKSVIENAATGSPAYKGELIGHIFYPNALTTGQTYYWRIDAHAPDSIIKGDVWSFTAGVDANPPVYSASFKIYALREGIVSPLDSALISMGGRQALTGSEGESVISMLKEGEYNLKVQRKGYEGSTAIVYISSDTILVDTLGHTNYEVSFLLKDKETEAPIPFSTLVISGENYLSGPDGRVDLTEVEYGWYTISARAASYVPSDSVRIEIWSDSTVVIVLMKKYLQAMVKVVDRSSGEPVNRAVISYGETQRITDSSGEVVINNIFMGPWVYEITHDKYFNLRDSANILQDTTLIMKMTRKLADIVFYVEDSAGPLQGIPVRLDDWEVLTDGSGTSLFLDIQARQGYDYLIAKEGYTQVKGTLYVETDTTLRILLETATGLQESSGSSLWFYPNPVQDKLHISFGDAEAELRLCAMDGKLLLVRKLFRGTETIDLGTLPEGCYLLNLRSSTLNHNRLLIKMKE